MSNFHKVLLQWPHTEPSGGVVTGTFDNWSRSVPLTKTSTGLEASVDIPWGQKIKYKFVVDGQWLVLDDQPTEVDAGGYVNNVYTAPPKPITQGQHVEGISTNGEAELAETERADSLSQAAAVTGHGFPQLLSDVASTVIARDGTSSALEYMASGLGGVVNSFVGIDPINAAQSAISTSKLDPEFDASASASTVDQDVTANPILPAETSPDYMPSPVASLVPIAIVQVNAPDNNIIASSSSPNLPEVENPPLLLADVAPASSEKGLGDTPHASALAPELHVQESSSFSEPSAETEKSLVVVAEVPSIPHADQEIPETVLTPQENVPEVTAAPSDQGKLLVVDKEASPKDIVCSPPGLAESGDRSETPAISVSPSSALDSVQAIPSGRATPTSTSTSFPSAPSTPVKRSLNPFPTSSPSSSVNGSPSSSKFGTPNSARKKRNSIFGKLKHIFHHDKDKEKGKQ